jgi:RNA polymerase sigma-70 factor (ECF subfamily)
MLMADVQAPEPTDEALIMAVKNGSHEAFEQILRRYRDAIYGYLKTLLKDPARTDDAAQDVFLRLFRGASHYKVVEGGRFKSWLFMIAVNVARNALRSRRAVPLDSRISETLAASAHDRPDADERRERVQAALESLPEEQRQVVVLKEYQGLTFEEVARVLDIPVNTAKSRMRYGLLKLSELLQGYMR